MKYSALVPLRGQSKSIPYKNIRLIAGKPLCQWVIEAALHSGLFDEIVVSTEDSRIARVVRDISREVRIIDRPPQLATDRASTESVMTHMASIVDFDVVCTLQATSPLTRPEDLRSARHLLEERQGDSLLTATRTKRFFWNENSTPINYDPQARPRRQDFAGTLMENGAFYFTRRWVLNEYGSRLGGNIVIYEMPQEAAVEIDEPDEWEIVSRRLESRSSVNDVDPRIQERAHQLRYVFFDVDGTLTDGMIYYSAAGEQLKRFSTRDGMGIRLLREAGIDVGIMTSETSDIVSARARKLGISDVFLGVQDKAALVEKFSTEKKIPLNRIGFMGDDLNDLNPGHIVGFCACPSDAADAVIRQAHLVTTSVGGKHAVREFCDRLLDLLER